MLLIPGYDTNLHQTCGDKYSNKAGDKYTNNPTEPNDDYTYTMPTDVSENGISKLFVSIHYYDPLGGVLPRHLQPMKPQRELLLLRILGAAKKIMQRWRKTLSRSKKPIQAKATV